MTTFEMRTQPGEKAKLGPVEYIITGEGSNVASRKATDADRAQWAEEYAAFKAGTQPSRDAPARSVSVSFEMRVKPGAEAKGPMEYVTIPQGSETVCRPATDADRLTYLDAYKAFKAAAVSLPGPVAVEAAPILTPTEMPAVEPAPEADATPAETPKSKRKKILGVI